MKFVALPLISLLLFSCGGTHGGNPKQNEINLIVGSTSSATISSMNFCPKTITLLSSADPGLSVTANVSANEFSVGSAAPLATISAPSATFDRVEVGVSGDCSSLESVRVGKSDGNYSTSSATTLVFEGSFAISEGTRGVKLDIQPIIDQLAAVTADAQVKPAVEAGIGVSTAIDAFAWVGAGANALWSTAANWYGGVVPGATDTAVFDSNCVMNCSPTISSNINVGGISIQPTYLGTITQAPGITVTTKGYFQGAGTFIGGNSSITIDNFIQSGGTFNAPSGTLRVGQFGRGTFFSKTGGTFNPGSGKVRFYGGDPGCAGSTYTLDLNSTLQLNDVEVDLGGCQFRELIPVGAPISVGGDLTHIDGSMHGSWLLQRNLIVAASAKAANGGSNRPAGTITFNGSANQTYSYASGQGATGIVVNKSSGSVAPATGTTSFAAATFSLVQGSFQAPSGNFLIGRSFGLSHTLFHSSGGTFDPNGGTVQLSMHDSVGCSNPTYTIDVQNGFTFNHLQLMASSAPCQPFKFTTLSGKRPIVVGNFTSSAGFLNGPWELRGNVSLSSTTAGDASFLFSGAAVQSVSNASGVTPTGAVVISKTGGSVNLGTAWSLAAAGQPLTLTTGTLNMQGFALSVNGLLTHDGTINRAGGLLTYGSLAGSGTINP